MPERDQLECWVEKAQAREEKGQLPCRADEATTKSSSPKSCRCRRRVGNMTSSPRFLVGLLVLSTALFGLYAAGISGRLCRKNVPSEEKAGADHQVLGLPGILDTYLPGTPKRGIPSEPALNAPPSRDAPRAPIPKGLGQLLQRQVSTSGSEAVSTTAPTSTAQETTVATTTQPSTTAQTSTEAQTTIQTTTQETTAATTQPSTTAQTSTEAQTTIQETTTTTAQPSTTAQTSTEAQVTTPTTTETTQTSPTPTTTTTAETTTVAASTPTTTAAASTITTALSTTSPSTMLVQQTSTFTSTLPGGGATTLTSVYVVAETHSAAATSTGSSGEGGATLQTGAAQPRHNGPALKVMVGAVIGGAFLV